MQTKDNVISVAYLQCGQNSACRTDATIAHFAFRPGPPDQEEELVAFWRTWWNERPELR